MAACPFHYRPYRSTDQEVIDQFIDVFPLAIITSQRDGQFLCSHIPLWRQPDGSLFGHADGANPQFNVDQRFSAQVIFVGESGYIPPQAYSSPQLPTWNYAAVHMQAHITVTDAPNQNLDILKQTAMRLAKSESDYQVDERDPRVINNLPHIRGLLVTPVHTEGRFKLSQDKSFLDSSAALAWLIDDRRRAGVDFLSELHRDHFNNPA